MNVSVIYLCSCRRIIMKSITIDTRNVRAKGQGQISRSQGQSEGQNLKSQYLSQFFIWMKN